MLYEYLTKEYKQFKYF